MSDADPKMGEKPVKKVSRLSNREFKKKRYLLVGEWREGMRTARLMRLLAKTVDCFVGGLAILFFYPFGVILALAYLSLADSFGQGESLGKRVFGFRVVGLENGKPCSPKASFIRNLPITVPVFFLIIPIWGWFVSLFFLVPLVVLEIYFILKLDSFHRLGDVMAETTVIANDPHGESIREKWGQKIKDASGGFAATREIPSKN